MPRRNDSPLVAAASRSLYSQLLDAGIEIHEYTKGLLHAKTLTVDRAAAPGAHARAGPHLLSGRRR